MYKLQIIPQCFTICIQFMYKTQDVAGQHTACLFTEIQIQKEIANFSAKQKIRSKTIGKRKCTALFLTNIQSHRQHCDQFIRQSSDSKYDQCEKKKKKKAFKARWWNVLQDTDSDKGEKVFKNTNNDVLFTRMHHTVNFRKLHLSNDETSTE